MVARVNREIGIQMMSVLAAVAVVLVLVVVVAVVVCAYRVCHVIVLIVRKPEVL